MKQIDPNPAKAILETEYGVILVEQPTPEALADRIRQINWERREAGKPDAIRIPYGFIIT